MVFYGFHIGVSKRLTSTKKKQEIDAKNPPRSTHGPAARARQRHLLSAKRTTGTNSRHQRWRHRRHLDPPTSAANAINRLYDPVGRPRLQVGGTLTASIYLSLHLSAIHQRQVGCETPPFRLEANRKFTFRSTFRHVSHRCACVF